MIKRHNKAIILVLFVVMSFFLDSYFYRTYGNHLNLFFSSKAFAGSAENMQVSSALSFNNMTEELKIFAKMPHKANAKTNHIVDKYIRAGDKTEETLYRLKEAGFDINKVNDPRHFDVKKYDSSHIADYKIRFGPFGIFGSSIARIIVNSKKGMIVDSKSFIKTNLP